MDMGFLVNIISNIQWIDHLF